MHQRMMPEEKTPESKLPDLPADPAELSRSARSLVVFRGLLRDPVVEAMVSLLDAVAERQATLENLAERCFRFCDALAALLVRDGGVAAPAGDGGNLWQAHLVELILSDENPFTRLAEWGMTAEEAASLRQAVGSDLRRLQALYKLDSGMLRSALAAGGEMAATVHAWPDWGQWRRRTVQSGGGLANTLFHATPDWGTLADALADHVGRHGYGLLGRYHCFRWEAAHDGTRALVPIADPDPVRLADLIGYEREREEVVRNTRQFLSGHPANNVLLYGDRGTGKSSTIKALANEYADAGLRLIEVPKGLLADYPRIAELLRQRRHKFILFVDDLSFEEAETEYKTLKTILDGGAGRRPDNVLVYATSNRRHLVREAHSDRSGADGDLRARDTMEEKLSFADRFGITVTYTSPDQENYLAIVAGLARRRNIDIEPGELRRMALQWELCHNGRSGRTARQFIEHLQGQLALLQGR